MGEYMIPDQNALYFLNFEKSLLVSFLCINLPIFSSEVFQVYLTEIIRFWSCLDNMKTL